MKKNSIQITDFSFLSAGHGHYKVTYQSPVNGKEWARTTSDMQLIDVTKNAPHGEPKRKDLEQLKQFCKGKY